MNHSVKQPVTVYDSVMGSGKTTWALKAAKHSRPVLYVTPLLSECDRAERTGLIQPQNGRVTKKSQLRCLLLAKKSAAVTHSLFLMLDRSFTELLQPYTLLLDETLPVLDVWPVSCADAQMLLASGRLTAEGEELRWTGGNGSTSYDKLREAAVAGKLIAGPDGTILYRYPPELFLAFRKVCVLTYLFESSLLAAYFTIYQIPYEVRSLPGRSYVPCELLRIYTGPMNTNISREENAFSKTWFQYHPEACAALRKNLINFFRNLHHARAADILWTCFEQDAAKIKGDGFRSRFLPCNCRSTNEYGTASVLAYCVNRYPKPVLVKFLRQRGRPLSREQFALSELLQWVWRSRIRKGEPVILYLPSQRMRRLLREWLYQASLDK